MRESDKISYDDLPLFAVQYGPYSNDKNTGLILQSYLVKQEVLKTSFVSKLALPALLAATLATSLIQPKVPEIPQTYLSQPSVDNGLPQVASLERNTSEKQNIELPSKIVIYKNSDESQLDAEKIKQVFVAVNPDFANLKLVLNETTGDLEILDEASNNENFDLEQLQNVLNQNNLGITIVKLSRFPSEKPLIQTDISIENSFRPNFSAQLASSIDNWSREQFSIGTIPTKQSILIADDKGQKVNDLPANTIIVGGNPASQEKFHGLGVAGIIAAIKNNIGITGALEISQPGTSLTMYEACDDFGCDITKVAAALEYADKNNIPLVNLSIGILNTNRTENLVYLFTKINNIASKNPKFKVIFSAGNQGADLKNLDAIFTQFPNAPKVIAIATAINANGNIAAFSNTIPLELQKKYPDLLVIVAPGENLYSLSSGDQIQQFGGTSSAAAYVTALIARAMDEMPGEINPNKLNAFIRKNALLDFGVPGPDNIYNDGVAYFGKLDEINGIPYILPSLNSETVTQDVFAVASTGGKFETKLRIADPEKDKLEISAKLVRITEVPNPDPEVVIQNIVSQQIGEQPKINFDGENLIINSRIPVYFPTESKPTNDSSIVALVLTIKDASGNVTTKVISAVSQKSFDPNRPENSIEIPFIPNFSDSINSTKFNGIVTNTAIGTNTYNNDVIAIVTANVSGNQTIHLIKKRPNGTFAANAAFDISADKVDESDAFRTELNQSDLINMGISGITNIEFFKDPQNDNRESIAIWNKNGITILEQSTDGTYDYKKKYAIGETKDGFVTVNNGKVEFYAINAAGNIDIYSEINGSLTLQKRGTNLVIPGKILDIKPQIDSQNKVAKIIVRNDSGIQIIDPANFQPTHVIPQPCNTNFGIEYGKIELPISIGKLASNKDIASFACPANLAAAVLGIVDINTGKITTFNASNLVNNQAITNPRIGQLTEFKILPNGIITTNVIQGKGFPFNQQVFFDPTVNADGTFNFGKPVTVAANSGNAIVTKAGELVLISADQRIGDFRADIFSGIVRPADLQIYETYMPLVRR